MSKKGAFIYQQIELTTAEWASNTTVYPASVWLFERLENGKFNMKLSDGVHTFAELPAVMQDIQVSVKTNNETTYILRLTTASGTFDTPNLRGNNAPVPSIDPKTRHWKIGDTDTGVVAEGKDGISVSVAENPENTETVYKLDITDKDGKKTTPNLRGTDAPVPSIDPESKHWKIGGEDTGVVAEGKNGESYDDTEIQNALSALQQQINTLVSGNASNAIESFNEIIAFLASVEDSQTLQGVVAGLNQSIANVQQAIPTKLSQLQNDDNTVKDSAYVHTDNNYSNEEKQKVTDSLRLKEYTDVTNISQLPAAPYNLRFTYSSKSATAINFANIGSVPEMQEFYLSIKNNTGSTINQPIPNGSGWQSEETSVELPAGKATGVSLKKEHGIIVVRV